MTKEFLHIMKERGFIHQITDEEALLKKNYITAYIGFDCTAKALHIGSLVQIMILRWLEITDNKPLVLMGGGTTKVGDPSGKDEARKMLSPTDIAENIAGISKSFQKFLKNPVIVNNADWLDNINYIEFLRDYGKHFSVNRMLSFDSVKIRLEREQNLSFLEFNYMLLQAYDFVELYKRYGCNVQIGGSDQWGNIINGVELGRRLGLKEELIGLTTPLITTANGSKMGKTANGAVWIDEDMVSAYDYFQYFRNIADADIEKFLKLFTELSLLEIAKLIKLEGREINEAKKILAFEATKICHGEKKASIALEASRKLFEEGALSSDMPIIKLDIDIAIPAYSLFYQSGLVESASEARRLIRGGGARINDEVVKDENQQITLSNDGIKLSSGKKKHILVIKKS